MKFLNKIELSLILKHHFIPLYQKRKKRFWEGEYIDLFSLKDTEDICINLRRGLCLQFNCHSIVIAIFSKRATFWDALYIVLLLYE